MAAIAKNFRAISRNSSYLMSFVARPALISVNKFHTKLQEIPNQSYLITTQVKQLIYYLSCYQLFYIFL